MDSALVKRCEDCKKPFAAEEEWKRKCILCWKKSSNYDLSKSDVAYGLLQQEMLTTEVALGDARMEVRKVQEELAAALERLEKFKTAYRNLKSKTAHAKVESTEAKVESAEQPQNHLTHDRVMQLIRLTHPDRHGGSALSNEVTKWLLELREKP